eukprot:1138987-Pelagomonas_calceolata.AAC.1
MEAMRAQYQGVVAELQAKVIYGIARAKCAVLAKPEVCYDVHKPKEYIVRTRPMVCQRCGQGLRRLDEALL